MKFLKKHPLFTGLLAVAITPIILVAADNIKKPTMVIDVGQEGYFIGVTPEYRYAVIAAILPYFSDAAKKLDLPIKLPITTSDLIPGGGGIYPFRKTVGGAVTLKSGWVFSFRDGYVDTIEDEHSYAADKNPYKTDRFFGTVNMTTNEAIAFARETIRKLGIPLESVFAEQEPIVEGPINDDNKIVPHYEVVQTVGPEHEKIFTVSVSAGKKELASGKGKNKKLAEQEAAKNALDNLNL